MASERPASPPIVVLDANLLYPFQHPDGFLCELHDADPELVRASAEAARANLSRSTPSFADYLDALAPQGLLALAQRLRA